LLGRKEPEYDDSNPDEMEIDFDTLQLATLRQLEAFVAGHFHKHGKQKPD
jgi:Bromodomain extra-terminal - transcription regulation